MAASNVVRQAGARVEEQVTLATPYYTVTTWWQCEGGRMQSDDYPNLSWTEATDVILVHLDEYRPGFEVGKGWRQPFLPFEQG